MALIHRRDEVAPPHGEVIRIDVRRPAAAEPRSAVLVSHGFKGFKDWGFFPYLCERLAADGHLVVSFNGSRNGVGPNLVDFTDLEAFGRNTFSHEVGDVHHMVDLVTAGEWSGGRRPDTVGILGHSRGGGTGIVTVAERDDVSSLVTWAAISTFQRWTREQREEWKRHGVVYVTNARTGQEMPLYRTVLDDLEANRHRPRHSCRRGQGEHSVADRTRRDGCDRVARRGPRTRPGRPERPAGGRRGLGTHVRGRASLRRVDARAGQGRSRYPAALPVDPGAVTGGVAGLPPVASSAIISFQGLNDRNRTHRTQRQF